MLYENPFDDPKERKRTRKHWAARDRSKFKKSDQGREKQRRARGQLKEGELLRGRVLSVQPEDVAVESKGLVYHCVLRGLFKRDKSLAKNIVTIGDWVFFDPVAFAISRVEERTSVLSRAANLLRHQEQLIAANIDQILITASVVSPALKAPLIDRYIIAARKGNMEPLLLINKIDLLPGAPEEEKQLYAELIRIYAEVGISVFPLSAETGEGLDALRAAMKDKASVFAGQSGVGKSALINAVTGLELPTGGIVHKTGKGSHTTTHAHLVPLEGGGWCIDTPGIKSFGVWGLDMAEVEAYFDEIHACGRSCRYPGCSHVHEPDCTVRMAVMEGKISKLRMDSYLTLLAESRNLKIGNQSQK